MGAYSRWVSRNPSASDKQIANVEFSLKAIDASLSYTFVIDSDAALQAWANNTSGNDYSRILINKGTWTLNTTLSEGTVIDISNGRTKSVIGESESKIVINNTGTNLDIITGIEGNTNKPGQYGLSNPGNDYFFRNVNIEINSNSQCCGFTSCANLINCTSNVKSDTTSGGNGIGYGFSYCINLSNCIGNGFGGGSAGSSGVGFYYCTNLTNCTGNGSTNIGSSSGIGFSSCINLTDCIGRGDASGANSLTSNGFSSCTNLTNCTGIGAISSNVISTSAFGFSGCSRLTNCTGYSNSNASAGNNSAVGFSNCRTGFGCRGTFNNCLMAQGTGPITGSDWNNTATGGWNLNAVP